MRSAFHAGLTVDTLASALEAFKRGELRQLYGFQEDAAERDDMIPGVKNKREKRLSLRDYQIVTIPRLAEGRDAEVARQKEILETFWWNVTAVNAYDTNDEGDFSLLVKNINTAASFRYAAHHIRWTLPSRPGQIIGAEFEFAPLHFFENTTGALRFCPTGMEYEGRPLDLIGRTPGGLGEWLVVKGDGLMMPCGLAYFAKRNGYTDWLMLSERIGMRPVIGRTHASEGSPAGEAMAAAVRDIYSDMQAVIYGDDGESKIDILDMGSVANIPMEKIVERADRRIASLYLGGDLSSLSSTQGQGSGASLQAEETALLEQSDAQMVQAALDRVSRAVLRYHLGADVQPLVWLKIVVPAATDQKLIISALEMLVKHGANVSMREAMERLGFTEAGEGEETLQPAIDYNSAYAQDFASGATNQTGLDAHNRRQQQGTENREPTTVFNASADEADFITECARRLASAASKDRAPLASALREVLQADDRSLLDRLSAFNAALPDSLSETDEQVKAWHSIIATAQLRGWTLGTPEAA